MAVFNVTTLFMHYSFLYYVYIFKNSSQLKRYSLCVIFICSSECNKLCNNPLIVCIFPIIRSLHVTSIILCPLLINYTYRFLCTIHMCIIYICCDQEFYKQKRTIFPRSIYAWGHVNSHPFIMNKNCLLISISSFPSLSKIFYYFVFDFIRTNHWKLLTSIYSWFHYRYVSIGLYV